MQSTRSKSIEELENKIRGKYLTEKLLGDILEIIYPKHEWLHDEKFKYNNKKYNYRPDYCCHDLKICVEFDGPDHFMKANVVQADLKKDKVFKGLGYDVIRIPYFIQLNTEGIRYFFNESIKFDYGFKHGFISKGVTLPASFCEQGIWKFKNILFQLKVAEDNGVISSILTEIKMSLWDKIKASKLSKGADILTVVPSAVHSVLGLTEGSFENINSIHGMVQCMNAVRSNLQNNWNCVILESSKTLEDQEVYNMRYTYNSRGDLSGYSFNMFYSNDQVHKHSIIVEKNTDNENTVTITAYRDEDIIYNGYHEATNITLFNLHEFMFPLEE